MVYTQVIRKCSTGAAPRDGTSHASGWEAVTNCVSSTVTDKEVRREVLFEDRNKPSVGCQLRGVSREVSNQNRIRLEAIGNSKAHSRDIEAVHSGCPRAGQRSVGRLST